MERKASLPAMEASYERYSVVAIQTAFTSASDRAVLSANLERAVELIEGALSGYADWGFPIKLVAFCEFCLQGIPYNTREDLAAADVLIRTDGPELERLATVAAANEIYVHTGTFLEEDDAYPGLVFNTACILGPDGIALRYRKVNNWIPIETFASPHLVKGYDEELFPVVETPLGVLGCLTCYDATFPESFRELAMQGAELVVLANAYPSPWQTEPPTNWLTIVPQVRSLENCLYTVNTNQGGDLAPFQFNGGSAVFDWEGRILAQTLQRGEQYVLAHIDMAGLRAWRGSTYQHLGPAHLRTDAFSYLQREAFSGAQLGPDERLTQQHLRRLIDQGRERWLGSAPS